MGRQPESLDLLTLPAGLQQHLNHECDTARIQVLDLGEIEQNALVFLFRKALISAEHGLARAARDISGESYHRNRTPRAVGPFVDPHPRLGLHFYLFPAS